MYPFQNLTFTIGKAEQRSAFFHFRTNQRESKKQGTINSTLLFSVYPFRSDTILSSLRKYQIREKMFQ